MRTDAGLAKLDGEHGVGGWWRVALVASLLAGCGASEDAAVAPSATPEPARYMMFAGGAPGPGWVLSETLAPGDLPRAEAPHTRWCASWRRGPENVASTPLMTLCGFDLGRTVPPSPGAEMLSGTINGLPAIWNKPGTDPRGVRIVQIMLTEHWTIGLVSDSVNVADLLGYAHRLRPVSPARWRAATTG